MKISSNIFENICQQVGAVRREMGGIIGSTTGECIDLVVIDTTPPRLSCACVYSPNVVFLNTKIARWQEKGFLFRGLFHSHLAGVRSLSEEDKQYIFAIMKAMPAHIDTLYFPVFVLPDKELSGYRGERKNGQIEIYPEPVEVV